MINLSAPKAKDGAPLSAEQIAERLPKPFPVEIEFADALWEVWVDFRRISPALANAYMAAYAKAALASKQCEDTHGLRAEMAALAQEIMNFGHVEGAVGPVEPQAKKRKGKDASKASSIAKNSDAADSGPLVTAEDIERVQAISAKLRDRAAEALLLEIVETADEQPELYEAKCAVVAAAIVRVDEEGTILPVGAGGAALLNYPDFDPTEQNLLLTGQIGPALVESVIKVWNPTSAGFSQSKTPKTSEASSTGLLNISSQEATPENSQSG